MSLPNDIKPIWEFDKDEYSVKTTNNKLVVFDRISYAWHRATNKEYFHLYTYMHTSRRRKLHPSHFLYWPVYTPFPVHFFLNIRNEYSLFSTKRFLDA
jgi:hypothetical protein